MCAGFYTGLFVGGGGDLLKLFHVRGHQACLTVIMTSEIQRVRANKLVVNKFQPSKCLVTETSTNLPHVTFSDGYQIIEHCICIKLIINILNILGGGGGSQGSHLLNETLSVILCKEWA